MYRAFRELVAYFLALCLTCLFSIVGLLILTGALWVIVHTVGGEGVIFSLVYVVGILLLIPASYVLAILVVLPLFPPVPSSKPRTSTYSSAAFDWPDEI
jgi:hypothetical protein